APGGPVHVLVTDREAEHIPGCNMAFRKSCLDAIGGFDAQFRTAGDDVDVCWRLQERGWKLGFHPAAVVWHHRRNSVRTYWRQQIGYGRAEAMLERKWPEKYNGPGHVRWVGRLYGNGLTHALGWRRPRVYHGVWGGAPFQSLYQPAPSILGSLPQMPEWHLMTVSLAAAAGLSVAWAPFKPALAPLWRVTSSIWTEHRDEPDQRLKTMEEGLRAEGACVLRGGRHDRWDLEVRGGFFGAARLLLGVEDHPGGHQMLRLRWWPD